MQVFLGVSLDFLKYFKNQITDMLFFHLIFGSDIKILYLFASLILYKLQKYLQ